MSKFVVCKLGCIIYILDSFKYSLCVFLPEGQNSLSTNAHWQYISSSYLARFKTSGTTADLFEFSHKNIPFAAGFGYRYYVVFSTLIIWMSGIGYPT